MATHNVTLNLEYPSLRWDSGHLSFPASVTDKKRSTNKSRPSEHYWILFGLVSKYFVIFGTSEADKQDRTMKYCSHYLVFNNTNEEIVNEERQLSLSPLQGSLRQLILYYSHPPTSNDFYQVVELSCRGPPYTILFTAK